LGESRGAADHGPKHGCQGRSNQILRRGETSKYALSILIYKKYKKLAFYYYYYY
jgi:hypothetical protein